MKVAIKTKEGNLKAEILPKVAPLFLSEWGNLLEFQKSYKNSKDKTVHHYRIKDEGSGLNILDRVYIYIWSTDNIYVIND